MAIVNFKKGLLSALPASYAEGTFYVTTDERAMYLDISDSERIRLGDFQEFATLAALKANTNPSTAALYYIEDVNCLAKWNGTDYIQINLDTGATAIEVVGSGNAVTAASYDAATRKITLTKGETFATQAFVGEIPEGYTESTIIAYINKKAEETLNAASGGSSESAASVLAALNTYKTENDPKVAALEEKVGEKAVGTQIDEKIAALDLGNTYEAKGEAAKVQGKLDEEIERAQGAESVNAQAAADALAEAQKKVASVAAGDASVTISGTATAPTVAAKISQDADNALALAADGLKVVIPAAAEYSIVKAAESGEYAAVYNLTKDGAIVGASINIPKDLVVKSGSVVDGNIVLVLNDEANTEIVIPADSLIEYVTSGSAVNDMVVIAVSDDHKVTATITDGSITLGKLATDVQTAIGKAHSHENADVLAGINADKVAAWDAAEQNAKDYADGLNTQMNTRVEALEAIDHEHENADVLAGITAAKVAAWDGAQAAAEATAAAALSGAKSELEGKISDGDEQALEDAKAYADGLAGNYDAKGDAATAENNAKAYADGLLTWGSF